MDGRTKANQTGGKVDGRIGESKKKASGIANYVYFFHLFKEIVHFCLDKKAFSRDFRHKAS